jgi:hypothetical protein
MAYDAEKHAKNSEAAKTNAPGYCLKEVRQWAGIPSKYNDAATAWKNTNDRHPETATHRRGSAAVLGWRLLRIRPHRHLGRQRQGPLHRRWWVRQGGDGVAVLVENNWGLPTVGGPGTSTR